MWMAGDVDEKQHSPTTGSSSSSMQMAQSKLCCCCCAAMAEVPAALLLDPESLCCDPRFLWSLWFEGRRGGESGFTNRRFEKAANSQLSPTSRNQRVICQRSLVYNGRQQQNNSSRSMLHGVCITRTTRAGGRCCRMQRAADHRQHWPHAWAGPWYHHRWLAYPEPVQELLQVLGCLAGLVLLRSAAHTCRRWQQRRWSQQGPHAAMPTATAYLYCMPRCRHQHQLELALHLPYRQRLVQPAATAQQAWVSCLGVWPAHPVLTGPTTSTQHIPC
jgi:hypothetical protein